MALHSSILAWKIPWMEEPGRLQSMGSRRVRHAWVTSLSLFTFMHWRRKWQPTSSVLAWRIPGMGSHRVRHDWSDLAVAACSFYSCFLESFFFFYHKWMLNFVKGFYYIYWGNHMVLSFNLLIWCITLIDLWILKNPCIPGIKPTWSWYDGMIFLTCCWILFARILWRILASMFISGIGL